MPRSPWNFHPSIWSSASARPETRRRPGRRPRRPRAAPRSSAVGARAARRRRAAAGGPARRRQRWRWRGWSRPRRRAGRDGRGRVGPWGSAPCSAATARRAPAPAPPSGPDGRLRSRARRRAARRATSEPRNSRQKLSVSASPTSRPMISRHPVSCTACVITMHLRATRPPSRTFSTFAAVASPFRLGGSQVPRSTSWRMRRARHVLARRSSPRGSCRSRSGNAGRTRGPGRGWSLSARRARRGSRSRRLSAGPIALALPPPWA